MPRRALRPSFVVTLALGAAAMAGGCSSKDSGTGNGSIGDGSVDDSSIGDGSSGGDSSGGSSGGLGFCNPPSASYCQPEAAPGVDDAAADVSDAGSDGEGQDGGHIADATGDVAPDAGSE